MAAQFAARFAIIGHVVELEAEAGADIGAVAVPGGGAVREDQ